MKITGQNLEKLAAYNHQRVLLVKTADTVDVRNHNNETIDTLNSTPELEDLFKRRDHFDALVEDDTLNVIRYAPLHGHSGYSLLDGASQIDDMVEKAEHHMAITDHGNMFGTLDFYKKMTAAGKHPILGSELYSEDIHGEKKRYHLLVLAETLEGYKNLSKLSSKSYDNFYYKPQVSYDMLRQHSKGLIVTSACMSGEVSKAILRDDMDEARLVIQTMVDIFGTENYFIELQRHDIEEEKVLNVALTQLAEEFGLKMVATADSHYTNEEDRESQEILMCIGTKKKMEDPDRMKFDGHGYHIHTSNEMADLFADCPDVLDNTLDLAERIQFKLPLGELYMPSFDVPAPYASEKEFFIHQSWEGFKARFGGTAQEKDPVYLERMQFEIDTINEMGFPGYFLITWDVIKFAKDNGILVGPGRGSACGSLVAYALQITDIDPIPYGLLFERFLNPDRVSMPDIDTDFPDDRRDEVVTYVKEKYGVESVAQIVTFTRLTAKAAVKDVARVLGFPPSFGDKISKTIPATPGMTFKQAFNESSEFNSLYQDNADVKQVVDHAVLLEKNPRNTGVHACFAPDTLVTTKEGLTRIADVKEGMEVLTHKNQFKKVGKTMVSQTEELYHIQTPSAFPLTTTGNHPFYVREMTRKRSRKNRTDVSFKTYGDPTWKPASELEVGKDYVGIPINHESVIPTHAEMNLPFNDEDFWWVIGRYLGDGWTECHTRNNKIGTPAYEERRVIICCTHKHENDVNDITERLDRLGFKYRVEKTRTTYKVHINVEGLYDYLQTFGKYAHGKKLNGDILNLPIKHASSALTGYLSADGHFQEETQTHSFKTVSKELATGMMQLINKVYKRPCWFQILSARIDVIEGREVNAKERYNVMFREHARKKEQSYYDGNGYIWTRVKQIEIESKQQDVYNLTVLDDSSYVVHGVAVHNCGYLISPTAVTNYLPQFKQKDEKTGEMVVTTQYNKDEVEEMGLLKMDFLGLRTMGVIAHALEDINERRLSQGETELTLENIPMFDLGAFKHISKGHTAGVFQLESGGMTSFMKQLFQDVDDLDESHGRELFERLVAGISLYRPGPIDEIPNYIRNMLDRDNVVYDTPEVESILKNTYGIIVYQEQCMQIVRQVAGFTRGQSDTIRKGMAKKKEDLLNEYGPAFISGSESKQIPGAMSIGVPEDKASLIWDKMVKFSKYAFNKSHAVGYSYISSKTAYLAAHYPVEYLNATLNSFINNANRIKKYMAVAKRQGIPVLPPDINHSQENFSVDGESIRFGLKGIRSVGGTSARIIEERNANGEFDSFKTFITRMLRHSKINRMVLESLIYAGALDAFDGTRKEKLLIMDELLDFAKMLRVSEDERVYTIFDLFELKDDALADVKVNAAGEMERELLLERERKYAGFYITEHPIAIYEADLAKAKRRFMSDLVDEVEEIKETRNITEYESRNTHRIAGVITELNTYYTKKDNQPLNVFTVEDETGEMRCVAFSDVINRNKGLFKEGQLVFIEGTLRSDEKETQVMVGTIADAHDLHLFLHPTTYVLKGAEDKVRAREQFLAVKELQNRLVVEAFEDGIPLIFVQDNQSFPMGISVPDGMDAQIALKQIVGELNVTALYE